MGVTLGIIGGIIVLISLAFILIKIKGSQGTDIDTAEKRTQKVLQKSFEGSAICDFDKEKKVYTIISTNPLFPDIIDQIDNPSTRKVWDSLVNSTTQLSQTIYTKVGEGYTVRIVNPGETETIMLNIYDGKKTYDFAEVES